MLEDELHLAAMEVVVEIGSYRELRASRLERRLEGAGRMRRMGKSDEAQVRHDPEVLL
jgi:hypothetical protein